MCAKTNPRRRSFGSVTEIQRGKKYVCRWVENTDTGRKRRSKTVHGTYREACRFLSLKEIEVGDQKRVPTFAEAWSAWMLPEFEQRVADGTFSPRTLAATKYTWKGVAARFGSTPLDKVRVLDVQEWLLTRTKHAATRSLVLMRQVMDKAVSYEVIPANKLRVKLRIPTTVSRTKSTKTFTVGQLVSMSEKLRDSPMRSAFITSAFGSARVGESLGVKCEDVREVGVEDRRYVVVDLHRQMPQTGHEPLPDGSMKNPQSYRTTIIPYEFGAPLLATANERRKQGLDFLSVDYSGQPANTMQYTAELGGILGDGWGVPSKLRASWRTNAEFEWNIEPAVLEVLMGHIPQGSDVTARHYLFPTFDALLARFDARFSATWDK